MMYVAKHGGTSRKKRDPMTTGKEHDGSPSMGKSLHDDWPSYTVAIRTLGTAGDKFIAQLDSLHRLVPAPESINVYIPYGYQEPAVPYSGVKFFRCDKGMVAQRSLSFEEIETEWILFLDDDIVVPEDGVARLFKVADAMSADCVSVDAVVPDGYANMLKYIIVSGWWPHRDAGTAFKVGLNGEYTYSRHPVLSGMATECVCFGHFLVRRSAHLSIRYEEERWYDRFGYTIHDELTYAKRLMEKGYRIVSYFTYDFIHLDAKCGHSKALARTESRKMACRLASWHRNVFNTKAGGIWSIVAFVSFMTRQYLLRGMRCLVHGEPSFFWRALVDLWKAWRFMQQEPYCLLKPLDTALPSGGD